MAGVATQTPPQPGTPLAAPNPPARRRPSLRSAGGRDFFFLLYLFAFIVLTYLVIYPIALLAWASFEVGPFLGETEFGLENWRTAIESPQLRSALGNTLTLTLAHVSISTTIALGVSWLLARTDLPGKGWLEFGFWIAFFLPSLTVILAWILMFKPEFGAVNTWLADTPLSFLQFDIYSWKGIVIAHLVTTGIAIKVMLLTPLLRNTDPSLEEAAMVAGASRLMTMRRIVLPTVLPGVLVVVVFSVIKAFEAFELELILGAPDDIDVLSTLLYRLVQQQPPQYGSATSLAILMLLVLVPIVLLQQYLSTSRRTATITGKYTVRTVRLGKARWVCFALVFALVFVLAILPAGVVLIGTFMKRFGFFDVPEPWTTENWSRALDDSNLTQALQNTLMLGALSVVVAAVAFTFIAYVTARTRYRGRALLDFQTWLPTVVPGVVLSLGFLWLFLNSDALKPLYGTLWALVIAIVLSMMTIGVQVVRSNMVQLGNELEEAAWTVGAGRLRTILRIVLPPIAPSVAVVMVLVFASAARATSPIVLLTTRETETLAIRQLQYMAAGEMVVASVIGVGLVVLVLMVALVARLAGLKLTVGER